MKSPLISKKNIFGKEMSLSGAYGSTVLICFIVSVSTIVLQVGVMVGIFALARKPAPILVETQSGESLIVKDIPSHDRDPKAISQFTGEILTMMLSWSGYLPDDSSQSSKSELDRGIQVEKDNQQYTLPTSSWEASFALEQDFREEFLPELAQFVPKSIFQGQAQTFYVPQFVGEPIAVGKGRWKLDTIGSIHIVGTDNNQLKDSIPFNRTIYVRAITPMFKRGIPEDSQHDRLAYKVLQIRSAALEIYAITELEKKEIGN